MPAHDGLFERAFFINADDSPRRRDFMERQLRAAGVRFERWPAIRGSPSLLSTHAAYFGRGVEKHLYLNRTARDGAIDKWGTIGTYLSHHTLFEHIVERWAHDDSAAFLLLQDDTKLRPGWLEWLRSTVYPARDGRWWDRVLLVWWGLSRPSDCRSILCLARPPAGPTEAGPDCCGKRYYHGLQAWIVKRSGLRCLLRRLRRRKIKNIDAVMVNCDCPRSYALAKGVMIGEHLDRELGSERAAVNSVWRAQLDGRNGTLRSSARRNLRKAQLTHLLPASQRAAVAAENSTGRRHGRRRRRRKKRRRHQTDADGADTAEMPPPAPPDGSSH